MPFSLQMSRVNALNMAHHCDPCPGHWAVSLSILCSLEGSQYWPSMIKKWGVVLPSLKVEHLHKLFGILLYGIFDSSIYLFILSFVSIWTHGYIFIFIVVIYIT